MKKLLLIVIVLSSVHCIYTQKPFDSTEAKRKAEAVEPIRRLLKGTWSLVLVDNILPDGRRTKPYGTEPVGRLMFDTNGRYALQILKAGRKKFASGDKTNGTAEENAELVLGSNSHFGRYSIGPDGKTIEFYVDHAFFPNWEGNTQIRPFTLTATEFRYTVPATTNGTGVSGEVVWKRELIR